MASNCPDAGKCLCACDRNRFIACLRAAVAGHCYDHRQGCHISCSS